MCEPAEYKKIFKKIHYLEKDIKKLYDDQELLRQKVQSLIREIQPDNPSILHDSHPSILHDFLSDSDTVELPPKK